MISRLPGVFVTILFSVFLLAGPLSAQEEDYVEEDYAEDTAPPPTRLHPLVRALGHEAALHLKLDEEQEVAVTELLRQYRQDAVDFPPADTDEAAIRQRGLHAAVRRLLRPDQLTLHDNWQGEHPIAQPPRRGKRGWLDVLLEDVATPLLQSQRNKRGGG